MICSKVELDEEDVAKSLEELLEMEVLVLGWGEEETIIFLISRSRDRYLESSVRLSDWSSLRRVNEEEFSADVS